jgi:hypothetical protein
MAISETDEYVEALSGEEVIIDLCSQLAERLRRDCNLRPSDAYPSGYRGNIRVHLELFGMDQVSVEAEIPISVGKPEGTADRVIDEEVEIAQEPALNLVRERSDQPVPTLANEGGELVTRPRRYVPRAHKVQ